MSEYIQSTNTASSISLAAGDTLFISTDVTVGVLNALAISGAGAGISVFDEGAIFGNEGMDIDGANAIVSIGASGSIDSTFAAVAIDNGHDSVVNNGDINSGTAGIDIGAGNVTGSGGPSFQGSSVVTNNGIISSLGGSGTAGIVIAGDDDKVVNTGTITGNTGVDLLPENAGHTQTVTNSGTIEGSFAGIQVEEPATTHIVNSGEIDGDIDLESGSGSVIRNTGTLNGAVNSLGGDGQTFVNTGTMDGNVEFGNGNSEIFSNSGDMTGGVFCQGDSNTITNKGSITGGTYGVYVTDGANVITNSGTITGDTGIAVNTSTPGGVPNTIFNSGLIATTVPGFFAIIAGNAGLDIVNDGSIVGGIAFDAAGGSYDGSLGSVTGLVQGSTGNDTLIGGAGVDHLDGGSGRDVIQGNAGDDVLSVDNDPISPGSDSAQIDGGDGNDTILMSAMFNANDQIDGGAGRDLLVLSGNYSAGVMLGADTLTNVEKIGLAAGSSYNLTMDDNNVAAGGRLVVDGSELGSSNALTFNGSAETDGRYVVTGGAGNDTLTGGAGNDVLNGGLGHNIFDGGAGADQLAGGANADTFIYKDVSDSTSVSHDIITGFNTTNDKFDLDVTVTGIDTTVASGRLGSANFDTNLANTISAAHLAAGHAVLFTPTLGGFAGHTFLIVDANGVAGYQAGQDYVFDLVTGAHLTSLATSDFI